MGGALPEEKGASGSGLELLDTLESFNLNFIPGGVTPEEWATVYGPSPLSLPKAKANGLKSVKLFGDCEQSGTPTPTVPVNIVCNNGALKYSSNELNPSEIEAGYYRVQATGVLTESPYNFITGYMPVKPNQSYVFFGRRILDDRLSSYNRIHWFDANKEFISTNTYTKDTIGTGVAPANAYFAQCSCNESGATSRETTQEIIDGYTWVFEQATEEVPYTPFIEGCIYTDGTVETVQDSLSNTATAEMLLKVGNYQDTQEVLSGHIKRNVGIKFLDGTESWQLATSTNLVQFYTQSTQGIIANNVSIYSTITSYGCTVANRTEYDFGCYSGNSGNLCFQMKGSATLTTANAWTTFLADQYAAGTPVIIVYPLATPTTETVTPQTLQTQDGTNTLQITKASINNLSLEATYKKEK